MELVLTNKEKKKEQPVLNSFKQTLKWNHSERERPHFLQNTIFLLASWKTVQDHDNS